MKILQNVFSVFVVLLGFLGICTSDEVWLWTSLGIIFIITGALNFIVTNDSNKILSRLLAFFANTFAAVLIVKIDLELRFSDERITLRDYLTNVLFLIPSMTALLYGIDVLNKLRKKH